MSKMPRKGKFFPFKAEYVSSYGLHVVETASRTNEVLAARCGFCYYYGRDTKMYTNQKYTFACELEDQDQQQQQEDGKSKKRPKLPRTVPVQTFRNFRTDLIVRHLETQHALKWEEYKKLPNEALELFFPADCSLSMKKKTVTGKHARSGQSMTSSHKKKKKNHSGVVVDKYKTINLSLPLIDFLNDFFLSGDEEPEQKPLYYALLEQFQNIKGEPPSTTTGVQSVLPPMTAGKELQLAIEKNSVLLDCVYRYLMLNLSIEKAVSVINTTFRIFDKSPHQESVVTLRTVSNYARLICTLNLHKISQILQKSWAFTIVLVGRQLTAESGVKKSILQVKLQTYFNNNVANLHLISILLDNTSTDEEVYMIISKFLDKLEPVWCNKIVSVITEGFCGTSTNAVVDILTSKAVENFYHIQNYAYHLSNVAQNAYPRTYGNLFFEKLSVILKLLRGSRRLNNRSLPALCSMDWTSLRSVSTWFLDNRHKICQIFEEEQSSCSPNGYWWMQLIVINSVSKEIEVSFNRIMGFTVQSIQQDQRLNILESAWRELFGIKGPFTGENINTLDANEYIIEEPYAIKIEDIKYYINGLSLFSNELFQTLSNIEQMELMVCSAKLYINLVQGLNGVITSIVPSSEMHLPPVLPISLVKLHRPEFIKLLLCQKHRLKYSFDDSKIDAIDSEHGNLVHAYRNEFGLRNLIDKVDLNSSFESGWKCLQKRFPLLEEFCGGLATIFPHSLPMHSGDLEIDATTILNLRRCVYFPLESLLHSEQFESLYLNESDNSIFDIYQV